MAETERRSAPWKSYPYALLPNDPELVFPAAEGDQGAESNTFYVAGRLRGRQTRREWAFLVIFAFNDIRHRLRADFYTFALFDLASGEYATFSEFDLPRPLRLRRRHKLSVARGHLEVGFASSAGTSTWTTRRREDGELAPFSYHATLVGRDAQERAMHLDVDIDTFKPPMPVGGDGVRRREDLHGAVRNPLVFPERCALSRHPRVGRRARRGRRRLGLDRPAVDAEVPRRPLRSPQHRLSPRVAADPPRQRLRDERLDARRPQARQPPHPLHRRHRRGPRESGAGDHRVPPRAPVRSCAIRATSRRSTRSTRGARYLADRYRLRVPAWQLDVFSEPLVPAPAHALPIEYWSGPTRIQGIMAGQPVRGFGFHERTLVFARDFELVDVLRREPAPSARCGLSRRRAGTAGERRIWSGRWTPSSATAAGAEARTYVRTRLRPVLERIDEPYRAHLLRIAEDLEAALG